MNLPRVVDVGVQGVEKDAILCVYIELGNIGSTLRDVYELINWECPVELEYEGDTSAL